MPRYAYECTKCGHSFELQEGWDAKPRRRCPQCRRTAQRVFAAPAIVFKGKGFYSTDNRRSSAAAQEEKAAESGSAEGSPGEDKKAGAKAKSTAKSNDGRGGSTSKPSSKRAGKPAKD